MPANRFIPLYNTQAGAVPTASALYDGELAVNITDGKLYTKSGSAIVALNDTTGFVSSSAQVVGLIVNTDIQPNSVETNEFKLTAGDVSLDFTGSITTGVFGISVDIEPPIPLNKYSGASIEYVAQRAGATRMGYILSAWLNSGSISFTEVSNADVGDTSDLTFTFLATNGNFRLRANSAGSGSGTWTIQSLFKLFPNLNI
jgi:hypothetical protein